MVSESHGQKLPVLVPNTASLVAPLLGQVQAAFANVAPERAGELTTIGEGLSLAIADDPKFVCHYTPSWKRITISTGVLEVLWVASHAYLVLHDRVLAQRHLAQPLAVELRADRVVSDAMALLEWGFDRFVGKTGVAWPDELPRPIESPLQGSAEHAADELALSAVAFLLHHELAHHRLGHPLTVDLPWRLDQERDADYAAADWILQGVAEDDARFSKRALGIATGLAVLAAYGVRTARHGGETHPRSFDRLFHTLSRHVRDDHDEVWAFVVGILNVHMTDAGFTLPSVIHASFKSCLDSYVEILAEDAARAAS
jgi:hypothetical protein